MSNIMALPSILQDIITAQGCTVHKFSHINNTGKRYTKLNGKGFMKNKPQKRDRICTTAMRPCHADLQPAFTSLLDPNFLIRSLEEIEDEITVTNDFINDQPVLDDEDNDIEEIGENIVDEVTFHCIYLRKT